MSIINVMCTLLLIVLANTIFDKHQLTIHNQVISYKPAVQNATVETHKDLNYCHTASAQLEGTLPLAAPMLLKSSLNSFTPFKTNHGLMIVPEQIFDFPLAIQLH